MRPMRIEHTNKHPHASCYQAADRSRPHYKPDDASRDATDMHPKVLSISIVDWLPVVAVLDRRRRSEQRKQPCKIGLGVHMR